MENLTTFNKRKKEWCLVYKKKYVLRIGTWLRIDKIMEKIPLSQQDDYCYWHISVCKDLHFVWPALSKWPYEDD